MPQWVIIIVSNMYVCYQFIDNKLPFFLLLYAFWLDTLILSVIDSIAILLAQNIDPEKQNKTWFKVRWAAIFLITRVAILLFYALFMVVFIGLMAHGGGFSKEVMLALVFKNRWFNLGILSFAVAQIAQLIFNYILPKRYLQTSPADYIGCFDPRIIVLHVVIVLGAFVNQHFASDPNGPVYAEYTLIALFLLAKIVLDLVMANRVQNALSQ